AGGDLNGINDPLGNLAGFADWLLAFRRAECRINTGVIERDSGCTEDFQDTLIPTQADHFTLAPIVSLFYLQLVMVGHHYLVSTSPWYSFELLRRPRGALCQATDQPLASPRASPDCEGCHR